MSARPESDRQEVRHHVNDMEGVHGFDFLHGSWNVANRRLKHRLVGSSEWGEFPGTAVCRGFFHGAGNIDEIDFPTLGFSGVTMRLFDPKHEEWSLYWANSRDGLLQPPVIGGFANGRGDFYGNDTDDGQPIRVHYLWSAITPQSARWQQAFSLDGESWETNWIMELTRAK
jgi:hypothetical protein